jgi:hypothetical protein
VFAKDKTYTYDNCEDKGHVHCIFSKEDNAAKRVKKLNARSSMYYDAFYEPWAVQ